MHKHGLLFASLVLASNPCTHAGIEDPVERYSVMASVLTVSPLLTSAVLLGNGSDYLAEISEGDRRVLLDARDGALQALANGDLADARLQAALRLLRSRFALDGVSDLQLAQWIAVHG